MARDWVAGPRTPRPISTGWHAHPPLVRRRRMGMSWRCRGAFVVPWPRFAWPCHPTDSQAPLGRHPDRRAEGPQWRDPFKQRFHKAPDAMPQQHKRCRCATLKNRFLASAVLRCALHRFARNDGENRGLHRVARNDDDGATRSGSRDGISPLGPTNSARWHAHACVGMTWRCRGAFVVPWPRFAWPCHPTDSQAPLGRHPDRRAEGPEWARWHAHARVGMS